MRAARHIRVRGIVQGVGFRPFVWRLAHELDLCGWVRNDSQGVEIAVEGAHADLRRLIERLQGEAPSLARIEALDSRQVRPTGLVGFHIAPSVHERVAAALVAPDSATCPQCLSELFDPQNRRWRHAFISCTQCGPRYTITESLPYDRATTTMRQFPMCVHCSREYADPQDRRFHCEPIACPDCGPRLRLRDAGGNARSGDAVSQAARLLREGAVVAIKGLGGYHLACDARNRSSVERLRSRKQRDAKPFALMAASVDSLEGLVELEESAIALLESPERPIVLMPRGPQARSLPPELAPGLEQLGVLLPATPIQWLLLHELEGRPPGPDWFGHARTLLVMTSANRGGLPLVASDEEACTQLAGIADAWLLHDRVIAVRCDDSVVQADAPPCWVRRARGLTPRPVTLPRPARSVLACGAHLKSTVCVTRGAEAFLSQHLGDLDNAPTRAFAQQSAQHLLEILEVEPELIAHDLHPDMPSTRLAAQWALARDVPLIGVQHHHAHVAAVAAEHGWREPLLGIALDGIGIGTDGGLWGGELLRVEGASMRRIASLAPLPLPGGDRAARESWRMAAAVLHALGRGSEIAARFRSQRSSAQLDSLLSSGVNCPGTSSMGRVFDAAAGLLGIATHSSYEGEAAMRLEACAARHAGASAAGATTAECARRPSALWSIRTSGELELLGLLERMADWKGERAQGAALFHAALSDALAAWVALLAPRESLRTVALAGGCFLNRLLRHGLTARLRALGFEVLLPRRIPPNDAAISLGQAWVAIHSTGD